jgi:hypothetical protein
MRWPLSGSAVVVASVVVALVAPAPIASAKSKPVKYPAYHRVQQDESMWSIARAFLVRVMGHEPTNLVTSNEVRQMRRLNRDTLHGSDQIYSGQRLLLAPTSWDVPDGKVGWGTGFTWCTNEDRTIDGSAPAPGLTLRVRLVHPPVDHRSEKVRFTIHNGSDQTRKFSTQQENGFLIRADGSPTAVVHSDAIGVREWSIPPGETRHIDGQVWSFDCGDTRYLDRPVPPGRYDMYGATIWGGPRGGDRGQWLSPTREVRVVRS